MERINLDGQITRGTCLIINKELIKWACKTFGMKGMGLLLAAYISYMNEYELKVWRAGELELDGAFHIPTKIIEEQLGLSNFQIRNFKQKLIKANIITVQKRGLPARDFYTLHFDRIQKEQ